MEREREREKKKRERRIEREIDTNMNGEWANSIGSVVTINILLDRSESLTFSTV